MPSPFPGFPQAGIDFLRQLARNNNREWFTGRKAIFEEQVKRPMSELVDALNAALARTAPEYITPPEKAIYRFYRDTRFTEDKRPYKEQIAATFARRGLPRHEGGGFYFAVSHKEVAVGGGAYLPSPEALAVIRRQIAERPEELRKLLRAPALGKLLGELQGERLTRVPKGYPADHPSADLLRFKQLYFYAELPPDLAVTSDLFQEVWTRFRAMAPFIEYLNAGLMAQVNRGSVRRPGSK
jgi:uncharacterized protein (TIGR02453 family)